MNLFEIELVDLPSLAMLWVEQIRRGVEDMFGYRGHLERLHEWPYLGEYVADPLREQDQDSRAHRQFYRLFPRVGLAYHCLAVYMGLSLLEGRPFLYQRVPSFRVQFPHSRAVGEAHRDFWYHHQPGELNCWLPLVDAFGTATVHIQTEAAVPDHPFARSFDRVAMVPVPVRYGQVLCFDAVNLLHGNRLNREELEPVIELDDYGCERHAGWSGRGRTRVSIDFRVLPEALYDPENRRESINTGTPFVEGAYWTRPPAELLEAPRDQGAELVDQDA